MPRQDGLPHPNTVGDTYLSAILDEIRALRKERPVPVPPDVDVLQVATNVIDPVSVKPEELHVKEPSKEPSRKFKR